MPDNYPEMLNHLENCNNSVDDLMDSYHNILRELKMGPLPRDIESNEEQKLYDATQALGNIKEIIHSLIKDALYYKYINEKQ